MRRKSTSTSRSLKMAPRCPINSAPSTSQVAGIVTNHVPTVTEVQLRFNNRGRASPVTIDLHDVYYADGEFRIRNESVARVSTLTFHRQAGPAKMEITVTSVKRKDAGNNLWQN